MSPLNDSLASDTYGLLVAELKIGLHLKAESSLSFSAFISHASHVDVPPEYSASSGPVLSQRQAS